MECKNCKRQLTGNEEYCPYCGEKAKMLEDNSTLWIILSAITVPFGMVAGVIALIFSIFAKSNFDEGKYDEYSKNLKITKITLAINLGLIILSVILTIILTSLCIATPFVMLGLFE